MPLARRSLFAFAAGAVVAPAAALAAPAPRPMTAAEIARLRRAHLAALERYLYPPALVHEDGTVTIMRVKERIAFQFSTDLRHAIEFEAAR